jgi:hypothetical protein
MIVPLTVTLGIGPWAQFPSAFPDCWPQPSDGVLLPFQAQTVQYCEPSKCRNSCAITKIVSLSTLELCYKKN